MVFGWAEKKVVQSAVAMVFWMAGRKDGMRVAQWAGVTVISWVIPSVEWMVG